MNKLFTKIAALFLGATMATGVGVAVAVGSKDAQQTYASETVEITVSNLSGWNSTQGSQTGSYGGITIESDNAANNTQLRFYSGGTHTFTSSVGNITSAVFTCTANGTSNYGPGKMSGTGYTASSGKTGTWTGNAASFTLEGGQSRVTSIVFTVSGGDTPADSVTVSLSTNTISIDKYVSTTASLTATATTTGSATAGLSAVSADTSVATVSTAAPTSGTAFTVTGVAVGSTTITVTSTWDNTKAATCTVTVTDTTPIPSYDGELAFHFEGVDVHGSETSYDAREADVDSGTASKISNAHWQITVGNNSAELGTNAKVGNLSKTTIGNGSFTAASGIATALGITTTTQKYSAAICTTGMSNIYEVDLIYTGTNGGNMTQAWVLSSTDGTTWEVEATKTSSITTGSQFNFFKNTDSRQYAFVAYWDLTNSGGLKGFELKLYGEFPLDQTITASADSAYSDETIDLTTNATSASWAITANTAGATLSPASGKTTTITPTTAGSVTVEATATGYTTVSKTVTFTERPQGKFITPSKNSSSGYTGQNDTITFTYGNITGTIGVESSDSTVVTISNLTYSAGSGSVKFNFVGAGNSVSVYFKEDTTTLATVSVSVTKTAFTTTPSDASIVAGKTTTLSAALNSGTSISWSSNATDKATVDSSTGVVTGVAAGSATITARSVEDTTVTATCIITVSAAVPEIEITYSSYSSSLPSSGYSVVDWSAGGIGGKIHSIKNTNSYIQFQASNSYIYNDIAVSGYITSITITKASGNYSQLTAYVADSEGSAITETPATGGINNDSDWTWTFNSSSHYCYFRINSSSSNAKYFSNIVIGYEEVSTVDPTGIHLNDSTAISMDTHGYGRRTLSATVEPFNAFPKTVTWGTSDSNVVTVSDGVLTPKGVGTTTVYATTANYVDDQTTPDLKASVSVTVHQAEYMKAIFTPTSASTAAVSGDSKGSVSLTGNCNFDSDKNALQIGQLKPSATFTIDGFAGMKILGVDLVMSSNADAGAGGLTITAGSTQLLQIESSAFSDANWNGSFNTSPCDLYRDTTDYLVQESQSIVFAFTGTINSLYIHSVAVRYIDNSLDVWCQDFLDDLTCDSTGINAPDPE